MEHTNTLNIKIIISLNCTKQYNMKKTTAKECVLNITTRKRNMRFLKSPELPYGTAHK